MTISFCNRFHHISKRSIDDIGTKPSMVIVHFTSAYRWLGARLYELHCQHGLTLSFLYGRFWDINQMPVQYIRGLNFFHPFASHSILWDAISYPCLRYLLLATNSSNDRRNLAAPEVLRKFYVPLMPLHIKGSL